MVFLGLETSLVNAYILYEIAQERKGESALSHYKFVKLLVSQIVSNFRNNNVYGRPSGTDKEQALDEKLHIISQLPKGRKKNCLVCSPKGSNVVKKQFSTVRPVNATSVCIPMNVLKNSTHYSTIININVVGSFYLFRMD